MVEQLTSDQRVKPCPFCGTLPEFRKSYADDCEWVLSCMNCVIGPYLAMSTKEDCIAYWNIREDAPHD